MSTVHVVPTRDAIDHTVPGWPHLPDGGSWLSLREPAGAHDELCPCGPHPVLTASGWLVEHHSLDGREQREST